MRIFFIYKLVVTFCPKLKFLNYSEHLFKVQAEEMVKKGFLEAGYEYIIIDDCWLSHERDANGKLQPDPDRFPSGIKALADYVRS